LVAALDIMDHFVRFLLFLGICIPPIAGVYIADFFFLRRRRYAVEMLDGERRISRSAFAAWILGSLVGYGSTHEVIAGSTVPACDAMVIAFVSYLALKCLPVRAWAMRARARSI